MQTLATCGLIACALLALLAGTLRVSIDPEIPAPTAAAGRLLSRTQIRPEAPALRAARHEVNKLEQPASIGFEESEGWPMCVQVLDEISAEPIQAFRIMWSPEVTAERSAAGKQRPVRDEHGTSKLLLTAPGPWILRVDGGEEYEVVQVDGILLPRSGPVVIHLPRAIVIEGTIRDDTGAPVAGAQVMLRAEHLDPGGMPPRWPLTATDSTGQFRFTRLSPGNYSLRVVYHDLHLGAVESFNVGAATRVVRDVTVPQPRTLRVTVQDALGKPCTRARVSVRFSDGEVQRSARSNADGVVALRYLPRGRAVLRVATGGFIAHEETVELSASVKEHDVVCRLAAVTLR